MNVTKLSCTVLCRPVAANSRLLPLSNYSCWPLPSPSFRAFRCGFIPTPHTLPWGRESRLKTSSQHKVVTYTCHCIVFKCSKEGYHPLCHQSQPRLPPHPENLHPTGYILPTRCPSYVDPSSCGAGPTMSELILITKASHWTGKSRPRRPNRQRTPGHTAITSNLYWRQLQAIGYGQWRSNTAAIPVSTLTSPPRSRASKVP